MSRFDFRFLLTVRLRSICCYNSTAKPGAVKGYLDLGSFILHFQIYIVATSFNYTDSQYSGGFVVVDQLSYIANDCPTSIPGPLDVSVPPAAPLVTFLVGSATTRAVTSSPISQVLPRPPNGTAAAGECLHCV